MENIILTFAIFLVSIAMFIVSFRSFKEKGFLFNNAYLYASKKERETMDKKPHYRQTAIVSLLLGVAFALMGVEAILDTGWLFWIEMIIMVATLVYAIVSSVVISRK